MRESNKNAKLKLIDDFTELGNVTFINLMAGNIKKILLLLEER